MKREERIEVVRIEDEGGLRWPGREALSERDRVMFESRSNEELLMAAAECGDEPEAVLGAFEDVLRDWLWLRDRLDKPRDPAYRSDRGPGAPPLDCWDALCN